MNSVGWHDVYIKEKNRADKAEARVMEWEKAYGIELRYEGIALKNEICYRKALERIAIIPKKLTSMTDTEMREIAIEALEVNDG